MKRHTFLLLTAAALILACGPVGTPTPPEDAGATRPRCGDSICEHVEKASGRCPEDCGEPTPELTAAPTQAETSIGTRDPDLVVDVYDPQKVWEGTTLLTDKHTGEARLIEVNMLGEIVWEHKLPEE